MDMNTVIQAGANLINVGVLAAALAFLLYRPVRDVLRKRSVRIQGQLKQAEEDMAKAEQLRLQYEQKIEESSANARISLERLVKLPRKHAGV